MSAAPTVSVVMTIYNSAPYLAEAMDSTLAQTFADFELIAIDDGSTDGSTDILRQYAQRDPRIRLTSRPNTGVVRAANEGIAQARGRYVARMDSDDVCRPERFQRQVDYLDAHVDCVLLGSRVTLLDPFGSPVAVSAQALDHEEIERELLTSGGGWAIVQPAAMMRADALRQAGGYRGTLNMSEDLDLFLRLAEIGRVANLPEPLLGYRRHYKSLTHTQYSPAAAAKEKILREAHERRGLPFPADYRDDWRPPGESEQKCAWGWAALKAGNVRIARRHAVGAVRSAPLSKEAWRLMCCAVRGR